MRHPTFMSVLVSAHLQAPCADAADAIRPRMQLCHANMSCAARAKCATQQCLMLCAAVQSQSGASAPLTTPAQASGEFFALVRRKLCRGTDGYEPVWGPVDTTSPTCPCGYMPLFPDNICIEAPYSTGCEDIECLNGLQPTYDGRCVQDLDSTSGMVLHIFPA